MALRGAESLGEDGAEEGGAALDVGVVDAPVPAQDALGRRRHALGHANWRNW